MIDFKDPWILVLIPVVFVVVYVATQRSKNPVFRFSSTDLLADIKSNWKVFASRRLIFLKLAALSLFLVALAAPRSVLEKTESKQDGIDIILTVDASMSMAAEDFVINRERVNRLAIVKDVVADFIEGRATDRIGLVVFAGLAYTVCPLTTDYDWLTTNLERVKLGLIKEDGTAIGSAIASSLNRLENSQAKSKVMILLTDGVNNVGKIDPVKAAEAAAALGIKIYTIGAGTKGLAPYPVTDFFGRQGYRNVEIELDEETLQQIAQITGGEYFRATDTKSLREIYKQIDQFEKVEIEETGYKEYKQLFARFLLAGLLLLGIELLLSNTILMRIP